MPAARMTAVPYHRGGPDNTALQRTNTARIEIGRSRMSPMYAMRNTRFGEVALPRINDEALCILSRIVQPPHSSVRSGQPIGS